MIEARPPGAPPLIPDGTIPRFGAPALRDAALRVHALVNAAIPELCRALPPSQRTDAALFLMRYGSAMRDGAPEFFRNFYAPSYTVLAHVDSSAAAPRCSPRGSLERAAAAHAMAMLLHSLDDHLCDGELPPTQLSLLVRSEAWRRYRHALGELSDGDAAARALTDECVDAYYRGVTTDLRPASLESYMDRFRDEMATWCAAPLALARLRGFSEEELAGIRRAYECFGIAWRLLDDLQDAEENFAERRATALWAALPPSGRAAWENGDRDLARGAIESEGAAEALLRTIVGLLREGAVIAEGLGMAGLAEEYRALAAPLDAAAPRSGGSDHTIEAAARENISVELTTRCGNACAHCFVRARGDDRLDMPFETALSVLRDARTAGYRTLHLTGGEPLLWEGLPRLLDEAYGMGFESVYINTTGAPLDADSARAFARYGERLALSISLQGPATVNDRLRGHGASDSARRAIALALDAGLSVDVFACAGKSLVPELPRFADGLFREYPPIKSLTLIQIIRTVRAPSALDGELLGPGDFIALVRSAALLNLYCLRLRLLENPLAGAAAAAMDLPWLPASPPLVRPGRLTVLADGAVTPAHSGRLVLAAFAPGSIAATLASESYRALTGPDADRCPACRHAALCRRAGMVRPSEWYRDSVESPPYCVRVLDALIS